MEKLSLLRGKHTPVLNGIPVKHPTLGDIDDLDGKYQQYLFTILSNSLDVADILWCEQGIWYEDIESEWMFFIQKAIVDAEEVTIHIAGEQGQIFSTEESCGAINTLYRDSLNYFLGLNGTYIILTKESKDSEVKQTYLQYVEPYKDDEYMIKPSSFKFTEHFYNILIEYLNTINWVQREYQFTKSGNKRTKKYILKNDYRKRQKEKKEEPSITLDTIVSALITRGQSWKDIWDYPIYTVYDLYHRTIKIDEWSNTMAALNNGNIDTKKNPINWEKINWASIIN